MKRRGKVVEEERGEDVGLRGRRAACLDNIVGGELELLWEGDKGGAEHPKVGKGKMKGESHCRLEKETTWEWWSRPVSAPPLGPR